jgi:hypothetical protein
MRRWALPLASVAAVLGILTASLGQVWTATRARVADLDRYAVNFSDIDCGAPPGLGREEFLSEVQYLAGMGERVRLLEPDLPARLARAFACHPWVERVHRVGLSPPGLVQLRLTFRTPALQVTQGGTTRAVDPHGVLLPPSALTAGLPRFRGAASAPSGPSGTHWGDAGVEQAARAAAGPR